MHVFTLRDPIFISDFVFRHVYCDEITKMIKSNYINNYVNETDIIEKFCTEIDLPYNGKNRTVYCLLNHQIAKFA